MNGGKLVIGIETDTKSFDAQIEATRAKLELLEKSADETGIPEQFRRSKDEAEALNVEIEKTRNQLIGLQNQQNKLDKSDGMNFASALSGLKKFGLGLIGIRGIYSLVSKASSAWLSQDTELAKKFQGIWTALGAALAPILEKLAELLMKLIGYVNVFVKAFTGGKVDLIANANAKAIQKQASAMKELKNQTYGFDELNIQQTNESSGSSSTGLEGFKNIKLDPKVSKFISDLGSALGDIWKTLKDIVQWCVDNLGVGGTIALGIASVLGIKAIIGGSGLLAILAVVEAIIVGLKLIGIIKDIKDTADAIDDVNDNLDYGYKKTQGFADEVVKAFDDKPIKDQENSIKNLFSTISAGGDNVVKNTKDYVDATDSAFERIANSFTDTDDMLIKSIRNTHQLTSESIDAMIQLAKQGKLSDEEIKKLSDYVEDYYFDISYASKQTGGQFDKDVKKIEQDLKTIHGLKATPSIELGVNIKDNLTYNLNKMIQKIKTSFSGITIGIGGLATGGIINKSALGSIVNNPGRGVYVGSNTIAGEAGKEGVIPLTDPNAMAELGETIGRYITVNLTNITKLDSKTINKTNNTISNDMNFIRNGGGA